MMIALGKAKFVEEEEYYDAVEPEEEYYDVVELPEEEDYFDAPPKDDRPPREFYKIISLMAKQHLRRL